MIWCGLRITENCYVLVNQFHGNFRSKTLSCREIKSVFRDVKWCFNASWGLKGWNQLSLSRLKLPFSSSYTTRRELRQLVVDVKWCFNASWGLKGWNQLSLSRLKLPFSSSYTTRRELRQLVVDKNDLKCVAIEKIYNIIVYNIIVTFKVSFWNP